MIADRVKQAARISVRCSTKEKEAFRKVAELLGIRDLTSWILMTCRREAEAELIKRGLPVPFLDLPKQEEKEAAHD